MHLLDEILFIQNLSDCVSTYADFSFVFIFLHLLPPHLIKQGHRRCPKSDIRSETRGADGNQVFLEIPANG